MKLLYQELPFVADKYVNFYNEDLPHFIVPWHYHPEIEIMYITGGTGIRFVGDHLETYSEGDICLIGPKLPHEWRNDKEFFQKDSGLRATCTCLFFSKEIFEPNLIRLPEMDNIRQLIERSRRGIKFIGKSRDILAAEISKAVAQEGVAKIINLLKVLNHMATTDECELLASVGFIESVDSNDFDRFNKIYQYLVKNFNKPVRLEDIADLVGLTPPAFCRYFKKRTKKTFIQYLNEMRIGHAKKLLIDGRMTISTLSMEAGFNNLSNFIEQFKKYTGMLPSEYQKIYGTVHKSLI